MVEQAQPLSHAPSSGDVLTVEDLRTALRLDDDPAVNAVLERLLKVAEATVSRYASLASCEVAQEASIRMIGYLYDMPESPSGDRFAAAFRNSGAMALLSPWKTRRAGAI